MGALGPALIFISILIAECLLGAFVLAYAARCFGVIVEATAGGSDEVTWPDEPMMDWLGRAFHLLFVLVLVFAPGAMIGRVLARPSLGLPPGTPMLPAVVLFWLLFPVCVLSSFSATSPWIVFRPSVLGGMFRVFPATVAFYFLTALLIAALAGLGYVTFVAGWALLLPVLAGAGAAGLFVYARLLGRLGLVLGQLERDESEEEDEPARPAPNAPRPAKRPRPVRGVETVDPWAAPKKRRAKPPKPRPPSSAGEGYGIASEEPAPRPAEPAAEPKRKKKPRPEGYALSEEQPPTRPAEMPLDGTLPVGVEPEAVRRMSKREKGAAREEPDFDAPRAGRMREIPPRPEKPAPPGHPFLEGVYTFPWYGQSMGGWLAVSAGLLAMGGLLHVLLFYFRQLQ
jgi:hypothetical protein